MLQGGKDLTKNSHGGILFFQVFSSLKLCNISITKSVNFCFLVLPEEVVDERASTMLKNVRDGSKPISFYDQPSSLIGASAEFKKERMQVCLRLILVLNVFVRL